MALKRKRTDTGPMSVPRSGLRPRIVIDGMRRAATRSEPQSLRDPFHVLGDHEVELIISHLDAKDTETLRRVSTLWRASSEYHCGRNMLLQHFPGMESKALNCQTREEMNLLFRRCRTHDGPVNSSYVLYKLTTIYSVSEGKPQSWTRYSSYQVYRCRGLGSARWNSFLVQHRRPSLSPSLTVIQFRNVKETRVQAS